MFTVGVLLGILAYAVFALGLLGLLKTEILIAFFLLWLGFLFVKKKNFFNKLKLPLFKQPLNKILFLLIILAAGVNFLGVWGPELSFDALWYHLTLPKLYLQAGKLKHISGNLLAYSGFPQLIEMLYLLALAIKNEFFAKLIHFLFGVGTALGIYFWVKERFNKQLGLLAAFIFYTQLAVGWLSISAYIDLGRTFFELLGLLAFWKWLQKEEIKWLIESGVFYGLAISSKLLAFSSVFVVALLIVCFSSKKRWKNLFLFLFLSLLIPLPWLVWNASKTGSFLYPLTKSGFFTAQSVGLSFKQWLFTRTPWRFIQVIWQTAFTDGDPLTPVYLAILPLFIFLPLEEKNVRGVFFYFLANFLIWFFVPRNYNRFLLPYTASFVFLIAALFYYRREIYRKIKKPFLIFTMIIGCLHIGIRFYRNTRFLPFILQKQSKAEFVNEHLNFNVGNFYDLDGWFAKNVSEEEKVLVSGVHNLFYLNFNFDHLSWVDKIDEGEYSYLLVQGKEPPARFKSQPVVYQNKKMHVQVYKLDND